jgi:hypothetical protein
VYPNGWDSICSVDPLEPIPDNAQQGSVRAHPNCAMSILKQSAHKAIIQAAGFSNWLKLPMAIPKQSGSFRPDPKIPISRHHEREDAVFLQLWGVLNIKVCKPSAVETEKAASCADPQIMIICLGKRLNCLLRQSILCLPDFSDISPEYLSEEADSARHDEENECENPPSR